jgi:hypothetical protein
VRDDLGSREELIAVEVIRVGVCDHDVANGLFRDLADRAEQRFGVKGSNRGIDDQHSIITDYKPRIRDARVIPPRSARLDECVRARSNFFDFGIPCRRKRVAGIWRRRNGLEISHLRRPGANARHRSEHQQSYLVDNRAPVKNLPHD